MNNITITENGVERETIPSDFETKEVTQLTEAETAEIVAASKISNYGELRAEAYPSLTEQADMAYWDRQNGTTTLDDAIKAVKDAYPKPVA
jgi:hypothetical protein